MFALRPAGPEDDELLLRIYASTREEELAPVPWGEDERNAFLRMQFDAQDRWYREQMPNATFDVVLVDGEPAGRLYVDRREAEIRIVDVALLPEFRGRGIGSEIIGELLAEGERLDRPVTIHVELGNRARGLYERLGFAEVSAGDVYALLERR